MLPDYAGLFQIPEPGVSRGGETRQRFVVQTKPCQFRPEGQLRLNPVPRREAVKSPRIPANSRLSIAIIA
jgi:hypothetical protein